MDSFALLISLLPPFDTFLIWICLNCHFENEKTTTSVDHHLGTEGFKLGNSKHSPSMKSNSSGSKTVYPLAG